MAGTEIRKEVAIMPALIMLAVRGHESRSRFEAILARVGGLVRALRV